MFDKVPLRMQFFINFFLCSLQIALSKIMVVPEVGGRLFQNVRKCRKLRNIEKPKIVILQCFLVSQMKTILLKRQ